MGAPSPSEAEPSAAFPSADATIGEPDGVRPTTDHALGRGDQLGRYLLLDPLGQGAMGRVFRAYDPDLDRQVAIKILHERGGPQARDRLLREAKAMARIHHPNVVAVHDAGMHEGAVFIAMEIVDGPSLDRWLAAPRSPSEILDALGDAARGLAAAHAAGVIHRDFKPANVLVGADGRAKVGDFGLAGIDDADARPTTAARTRAHAVGTPAYMSPEHFAGVGIDARSDQFSFGIALHEALHGTRPFSATTWPELAVQVSAGDMASALGARRGGIDGIIRRALAVDPAERFESMDALIAALERARRPVWRRWVTLAGVVGAIALVIATQRDATEVCEAGASRVAAVWNESTKAALRIGGSDYTEAFARRARQRFALALDDYAAQWAFAHDESCAAVGPSAQRGTAAQRSVAQCLDDRLGSLQGLAELATTEQVEAGRVGDLLGTLPELEDCSAGHWVPYPAEPEAAARAAELYRTLARIRRVQLMDRSAEVLDDAHLAVEQARELDEPYLLALALARLARVLDDTEEAAALLDEALELAIAGGFDWLAADIVNHMLLSAERRPTGWRELETLVAVARGLVERSGGDEDLLGNLALNESVLLRGAGRDEQAMVRDQQAEEHFTRDEDSEGIASARINRAVTMVRLGRLDEAIPRLRTAVQELEAATGTSSPQAILAQQILAKSLSYAGRPRESLAMAAEAHRRALELYTPKSHTLRQALTTYTASAINAGELELAREAIASLRALPDPSDDEGLLIELFAIELLQLEGRHDEAVRTLPDRRARLGREVGDEGRAWLEVSTANSLVVLGQHATAQDVLTGPLILRAIDQRDANPDLRTMVVLLALLAGASPPPDTTWAALLTTRPSRPNMQRMLEVIDALGADGDPTPTIRRVRGELAAMYHDREITVQVLDAWLAAPERGAR